jgi:hypothetical protein
MKMTADEIPLLTAEMAESIITRAHNQWEHEKTFLKAECEFWRIKYLKAIETEREECAKLADHDAPWVALQIRKRGEKP